MASRLKGWASLSRWMFVHFINKDGRSLCDNVVLGLPVIDNILEHYQNEWLEEHSQKNGGNICQNCLELYKKIEKKVKKEFFIEIENNNQKLEPELVEIEEEKLNSSIDLIFIRLDNKYFSQAIQNLLFRYGIKWENTETNFREFNFLENPHLGLFINLKNKEMQVIGERDYDSEIADYYNAIIDWDDIEYILEKRFKSEKK